MKNNFTVNDSGVK